MTEPDTKIVLADWLDDIRKLQADFDTKHKNYQILGHVLFGLNLTLISINTFVLNLNPKGYDAINTFLNFISVGLVSVRKYTNPEGMSQRYKTAYLRAKALEDTIEANTVAPQRDYSVFIQRIQTEKESILKEFY